MNFIKQLLPFFSICIVGIVFHLLYSHFGFTPTDEGFILSGSRYIKEGFVPHKDFISIRPTGSYYFNSFFLLFGKNTIYISRFWVWIEFSAISFIWISIFSGLSKIKLNFFAKGAISIIGIIYSLNVIYITVWHSFDALFLSCIATFLLYKKKKIPAYLIFGFAPLFKQNFIFIIPLVLILFGDYNKFKYILLSAFPFFGYILFLKFTGSLTDFLIQIRTYSFMDFIDAGVLKYLLNIGTAWGIILGFLWCFLTNNLKTINIKYRKIKLNFNQHILTYSIWLLAAFAMAKGGELYKFAPSFWNFGFGLGVFLFEIFNNKKLTESLKFFLIAICLAWSVSISLGYKSPALGLGGIVIFIIISIFNDNFSTKKQILVKNILFLIFFGLSVIFFDYAKRNHNYRDQKASDLKYDMGDILPGSNHIKTNKNTFLVMKELSQIENEFSQKLQPYSIIPDFTVNRVFSAKINPLPINWASNTELASDYLKNRVIKSIEKNENLVFIIPKYEPKLLHKGFFELESKYFIVNYVKNNFDKIRETSFFNIYKYKKNTGKDKIPLNVAEHLSFPDNIFTFSG